MWRINRIKAAILLVVTVFTIAIAASGCNEDTEDAMAGKMREVNKKDNWTEVGKDVFVFKSDFYLANMTLVTSGGEGMLVDTGMDAKDGQRLESFIKERNIKLKNIIITHMHTDHTANLGTLKTDGMVPITPENAREGQTERVGDKTLRIFFTEGHYKEKGHISVEILEDNILIAGDVICNNIIPPIAAGGDFNALLDTLKKLQAKGYALVIPGHGDISSNKVIFKRQFEYLNNARKYVEKIIASGGTMKDLYNIKLEDCIKDPYYLDDTRLDYWHRKSLETIYLQLKQ